MKKTLLISLLLLAMLVWLLIPTEWRTIAGVQSQREALQSEILQHPLRSALLYFVLYIAVTGLSLPGAAVMTLAGGALFGFWRGLLLVSFASTAGATIAFLLSRTLFRDIVQAKFPTAISKVNAGLSREGGFYLFALRLVPAFPFFLINIAFGVTKMSTVLFVLISQAGMLPGTAVYVFAGQQLGEIERVNDILDGELLLAFALLGITPLLLKRVVERIRRSHLQEGAPPKHCEYNLVVIGAGAAGLVTSYIAAAAKAKVALIEREEQMGGDCLNTGCVPSKALLRCAKAHAELRDAHRFGIPESSGASSFTAVMERVRSTVQKIAPHDSRERYEKLGVDCIQGEARVISPHLVQVEEHTLTTKNIVIATGATPLIPPIPGLPEVSYRTSETIWSLQTLPKRLVIVGGGPIGCEMAQAFQRLGSQVTLIERGEQLLGHMDPCAGELIGDQLRKEGVTVLLSSEVQQCSSSRDGEIFLTVQMRENSLELSCEELLIAVGRRANTAGLGLEEIGVELRADGSIESDSSLRTSIPNIFGCGDVTGPYRLTHAAGHQAWHAALNALLRPFYSFSVDYSIIPQTIFTDPEVAHVGLTAKEAEERKLAVTTTRYAFQDLDRAITDGAEDGTIQVLTKGRSDTILGVTIVGNHAGEILSEYVLAMKHGIGMNGILSTVHAYPTFAEANKHVAGVWKRSLQPKWLFPLLRTFHSWRRRG
ncbi:FAD-dependent oxidoreductase [bacterium]|nr:FAD-dependent oxidoreductase [bacterium]